MLPGPDLLLCTPSVGPPLIFARLRPLPMTLMSPFHTSCLVSAGCSPSSGIVKNVLKFTLLRHVGSLLALIASFLAVPPRVSTPACSVPRPLMPYRTPPTHLGLLPALRTSRSLPRRTFLPSITNLTHLPQPKPWLSSPSVPTIHDWV